MADMHATPGPYFVNTYTDGEDIEVYEIRATRTDHILAEINDLCRDDKANAEQFAKAWLLPELVTALRDVLALDHATKELAFLDKGIGTATPNAAWLHARQALKKYEAAP